MTEAVNQSEMNLIPARSRRQAMDWGLVLASQDIPAVIDQVEADTWGVWVEPGDYQRAREAIEQYRKENRHWRWRPALAGEGFHWGGLIWPMSLVFLHLATGAGWRDVRSAWLMDSAAVGAGEWWRLFTGMLLHADAAHLLANATTGVLLFGLAMAGYGSGVGLLASYTAGALGNVTGLLIYSEPYRGLGASGMVMGALGLIAVRSVASWRAEGTLRPILRALLAGLLLFVLLGTNPTSDVIAHLGGFVGGLLIGGAISRLADRHLRRQDVQVASLALFILLVVIPAGLGLLER